MMFPVQLDSSLAKLQTDGDRQRSHDFTIRFTPPIVLNNPDGQTSYEAALDNLINMSYSWYNVSSTYNNNTVKWRKAGEAWKTIQIPNRQYDYTDLQRALQTGAGFVDPTAQDKKYIFHLYFDFAITRVVVGVATGYELDLSTGDFGKLIGFNKNVLSGSTRYTGDTIPNITRGVDWIFIHCDLISRVTSNLPDDVIFTFSTADLQPSYPIKLTPPRQQFHPVNKSVINSIRVRITDGRNNILDLNHSEVALDITIRQPGVINLTNLYAQG